MVTYLAIMYVLLGLLLLAVDIHAGLPLPWILGEGPLISVVGLLMLYLHRFVPAD